MFLAKEWLAILVRICANSPLTPWAGVPCAMGWPTSGVAGTWKCGTGGPEAAGPPAGAGVAFLVALSSASESTKASRAADEQSSSSDSESLPKLRLAAGVLPD